MKHTPLISSQFNSCWSIQKEILFVFFNLLTNFEVILVQIKLEFGGDFLDQALNQKSCHSLSSNSHRLLPLSLPDFCPLAAPEGSCGVYIFPLKLHHNHRRKPGARDMGTDLLCLSTLQCSWALAGSTEGRRI